MVNELSLPALRPWGIVVLESAGAEDGHLWKPTILGKPRFVDATQVEIRCATRGANIRYTTDGSEPDAKSTLYARPLTLQESKQIKARAFAGPNSSQLSEATFVREPSRTNILRNGDFEEGMAGWEVLGGGKDKAAIVHQKDSHTKQLRIETKDSGKTNRRSQVVQGFRAREGGYYDLRWKARANAPITIVVKLQETSKPYRTLRAIGVDLDRDWKEFSLRGYNTDRRADEALPKSMDCRVTFDLSRVSSGKIIWLDDVQLEEDWLE